MKLHTHSKMTILKQGFMGPVENRGGDRFPPKTLKRRIRDLINKVILSIWEIQDIAAMPRWAGRLYVRVTGRALFYSIKKLEFNKPVLSREVFIVDKIWVAKTTYGDMPGCDYDLRDIIMTDRLKKKEISIQDNEGFIEIKK